MWFRVIKMMRRGKMQKSLRTCDISSKPAIKGKAGRSPGKHGLWSPDHGLATCSQESSGLRELREHPVLPATGETGRDRKQSSSLPSAAEESGESASCWAQRLLHTVSRTCPSPSLPCLLPVLTVALAVPRATLLCPRPLPAHLHPCGLMAKRLLRHPDQIRRALQTLCKRGG